MKAQEAFDSRVASVTLGYQNELIMRGEPGQLAFGLFRAQKRSTRAKQYRRRWKSQTYQGKSDALRFVDAALTAWAELLQVQWGWATDPGQQVHNQILYVEIPNVGQCSYHSERRFSAKEFPGQWDRGCSRETVLRYCDMVMELPTRPLGDGDLIPFGSTVGEPLSTITDESAPRLLQWQGITAWPALQEYLTRRLHPCY